MASNIPVIVATLPEIVFSYMIPSSEMLQAAYAKIAGKIMAG